MFLVIDRAIAGLKSNHLRLRNNLTPFHMQKSILFFQIFNQILSNYSKV